jgi:hypothetical protein
MEPTVGKDGSSMGDLNPWHILSIVMTGFTGLLTWLGLKQISRIEALERDKASGAVVSVEVSKIEGSIREIRERMDTHNNQTNVRLDNIFRELVSRQ